MDPNELERRLEEMERAEQEYRARQDRQIQDIATRVEILEKFMTERYG